MESSTSGWADELGAFVGGSVNSVQHALEDFVDAASPEQMRAWRDSIQIMQRSAGDLLKRKPAASRWGVIFEYRLPYEERRMDVVPLGDGAVLVVEFKGGSAVTQAAIDQVSAYARDLRAYHRHCHGRVVIPILVPARSRHLDEEHGDVLVVSPDKLAEKIEECAQSEDKGVSLESFLDNDAYCPQPTLVEATREIFESRAIREMWRSRAETDPAVERIKEIVHEAAKEKTRHLVLITGLPGAGKTLVGMRAAYADYLNDLAVERAKGKPTVPGLYLSGNLPLTKVLQYELRKVGAGGQTFVRHIKSYLKTYIPHPDKEPQEHLLVFDEAQRAFSRAKVCKLYEREWASDLMHSEPELFIQVCDRMPEWSVLIGLIGGGQEMNFGEEGGLMPWLKAIEDSPNKWCLHAPEGIQEAFLGSKIATYWDSKLNLDTEIRFHQATGVHDFVSKILGDGEDRSGDVEGAALLAKEICSTKNGLKLYITRDLDIAKTYLRKRYAKAPNARFGIIASSRDRVLCNFGVANEYMDTRNTNVGPWFADGEENRESCRHLEKTLTEFQVQGLEIDMALLAWGTDLMRENGQWTNRNAKRHRKDLTPENPFQLRVNSYRVLLTRGRDGTIVFVPPEEQLDETWEYLASSGFRSLDAE